MASKALKLTKGQNVRLSSIASKLAILCGRYLYNHTLASELDKEIIEKGREHFKFVKEGLKFERNELSGFSFDPETLHSVNALEEVYLVSQDIDKVLNNIEIVFSTLEGKDKADDEIIEEVFSFFTVLAEKVRKSDYNAEASHTL